MDEHRFDILVRNLAATKSRRQFVQGLTATATAAMGLRFGVVTTAGQVVTEDSGETCSQDSDCAPAEPDPCTGAFCDAGSCTYTSVACMRGHVCCGNGECCPEGEVDASPDVTNGDTSGSEDSDTAQPEATVTSKPDCPASS